jgi:hypothetical protein
MSKGSPVNSDYEKMTCKKKHAENHRCSSRLLSVQTTRTISSNESLISSRLVRELANYEFTEMELSTKNLTSIWSLKLASMFLLCSF